MRTPLSKQRNKHLQTVLIEAAKMAPRNSPELAMVYDQEKQKGNANHATLALARKIVAYLVAVDRRQKGVVIITVITFIPTSCISGAEHNHFRYCSSVTFSIHSTTLPLSCSWIAMCVMAVFGAAPCQCFTPAGIQMTSPFRISSIGPPHC